MSQAAKLRLEDLDIKPYVITKLKMAYSEALVFLHISEHVLFGHLPVVLISLQALLLDSR